ncbi:MAG: D-proline reductase (dithiol) proprotein PrdA [Fusobacteriaceae bacterium]
MSMSMEHIQEVMEKSAVSCCRTEAGTVLGPANLEDPAIFPDLEDSGLLVITDACLKVENVLGVKLIKTIDSLTPITREMVEEIVESKKECGTTSTEAYNEESFAVLKVNKTAGETIELKDLESEENFEKLQDSLLINLENTLKIKEVLGKVLEVDVPGLTPLNGEHFGEKKEEGIAAMAKNSLTCNGGVLRIRIGEGKNIDIELPLMSQGTMNTETNSIVKSEAIKSFEKKSEKGLESKITEKLEAKKIRSLVRKHFKIEKVILATETKIDGTTLYLRKDVVEEASKKNVLVVGMKIEIITPETYKTYSETIMDVQPIATKEGEDKIGNGVTRVLDGVVMMVTGTDENGVQIGEFGSSEGILEDNIMWGRPGAPDRGDIIIKTQVTIKAGTNMERPGPLAAHTVSDIITQEIRKALKEADEKLIVTEEILNQFRRQGKKKVVVIKEIMGQGAMHDNLILPVEPVGVLGGKPNVDLGNIPVMLSPLEVLDGGIHALTCIGPASKECSRHYFREPLVIEAMNDEEIDLCGVIFVGSPQINSEKFYVSERLGMIVEALDVQGAIITTEGFGNNHIDFASHIEQVGMRGIEVVGMSFAGVQGALVVGNKYMKNMVDNNKSVDGIENEILACNTLCQEDAIRALSMLKTSMLGEKVLESERKWNPNIKESNIEDIEKTLGIKITRSPKY